MKKKVVPYLLLAPMILIMGALVFYPVAATFSYSLKKWKLTQPCLLYTSDAADEL